MALNDLTSQFDNEGDKMIIYLLMTVIAETRTMNALLTQSVSNGDLQVYQKMIEKMREMHKEEFKKLKDQMWEHFGYTPPDLFDR